MPFSERSLMPHREEFCRLAGSDVAMAAQGGWFGISSTVGYE